MTDTVLRDARPPAALVRLLNPIVSALLRTPVGRVAGTLALVEFAGRHTGRHYRIPVGWHYYEGSPVVLTPARWRTNFKVAAPATVRHRGRALAMTGTLIEDAQLVADVLISILATGTSPSRLGLNMPPGHAVTASDVISVDRAIIRFHPAPSPQ